MKVQSPTSGFKVKLVTAVPNLKARAHHSVTGRLLNLQPPRLLGTTGSERRPGPWPLAGTKKLPQCTEGRSNGRFLNLRQPNRRGGPCLFFCALSKLRPVRPSLSH